MIDKKVKKNECTGCSACASICPKNCIQMVPSAGGFLVPECDYNQCISCKRCIKACPVIHSEVAEETTLAYAVRSLDKSLLQCVSSGGVFSMLGENVLRNNGVVFGAAFSDDYKSVYQKAVRSRENLGELRGSKYVQSDVRNTFIECVEYLKQGVDVLYCGTPCQIAGLKSFLGKNYENLIMVDVLCHGVPSPQMWEKYVEFRKENDDCGAIKKISFRNKDRGWRKYQMKFEYENGVYECDVANDSFLQGFLRHAFLRNSCYNCKFKTLERVSDLSLGDFWNIMDYIKDTDDMGTSLVFCHTEKGRKAIQAINTMARIIQIPSADTIPNGGLYKSAFYNFDRDRLMRNIDKLGYEELEKRYFSNRPVCRIKRVLARKWYDYKNK